MPKFELIRKQEAVETANHSSKRGKILALYDFFINQLNEGKAGRLQPSQGETIQAIRRRLNAAAKLSGRKLTIRTVNEDVFFWIDEGDNSSKKPRRKSRKVNAI